MPVLVLRVHQTFSCDRPPNIVLVPIVGERLFIEIIYCLLVSGREKSNSHDKCVVKPGKRTMKNINTGFRYFSKIVTWIFSFRYVDFNIYKIKASFFLTFQPASFSRDVVFYIYYLQCTDRRRPDCE